MPKYVVHITQLAVASASVEVEAATKEAARRRALEREEEGGLTWKWQPCGAALVERVERVAAGQDDDGTR